MKKLVLATAAFVLLAALPAMAYVQPGSLNQKAKVGATQTTSHRTTKDMDGGSSPGNTVTNSDRSGASAGTADPFSDVPSANSDAPTQPVPEPGTMAMASMGLLAIGAALRHKRGR